MRLPAAFGSAAVRMPVAGDKYYASDPAVLLQQLDACLAAPAPPVAGPCLQAAQPKAGGSVTRLAGLLVSAAGAAWCPPQPALALVLGTDCRRTRLLLGPPRSGCWPSAQHPTSCTHAGQVPHGSLQDSGMVAAAAFSLLGREASSSYSPFAGGARAPAAAASAQPQPARLLVLGTNHFASQPPACLSSAAAWRTPLGDVPVDRPLTQALAAQGLPFDDAAHRREGPLLFITGY